MCFFKKTRKNDKLQEDAKQKELSAIRDLAKTTKGNLQAPYIFKRLTSIVIYKVYGASESEPLCHVCTEPLATGRSNKTYLLFVDTLMFYHTWLESSSSIFRSEGQNCLLKSEMHRDINYDTVQNKFTQATLKNFKTIVRIPLVGVSKSNIINFMSELAMPISYWLILNNAQSFPLMVNDQESAERLYDLAGIKTGPFEPMTYTALFRPPIEGG